MEDYTKRCSACKDHLPYSEFTLKKDNTCDTFCRSCKKAYQKKHYRENKQYYKDRAAAQKEWNREWMRELKSKTPCADCGRKFHYCVMDFDHREGETKLFNLSRAWQIGREKVEAEIAKCDLVCANCHRMRTFHRSAQFDIPRPARHRHKRGLTLAEVDKVRILYATGKFTQKDIAQRFSVDRSTIGRLLRGASYKKCRRRVYGRVDDFSDNEPDTEADRDK